MKFIRREIFLRFCSMVGLPMRAMLVSIAFTLAAPVLAEDPVSLEMDSQLNGETPAEVQQPEPSVAPAEAPNQAGNETLPDHDHDHGSDETSEVEQAQPIPVAAEEPGQVVNQPAPDQAADETSAVASDEAAAPVPELTTLAEVLAKVWRDNPQIRQAELAVEATGFDITAARAGYFPYAQVQSALGQSNDNNSVSTLYFVQPLWSGGSTWADVDGAKARQETAIAELNRTRLDLGTRTLDTFLLVTQAQQQVIQWANYVAALKELLARVERRAKGGIAPTSDVQTALARVRQAQAGAEANRAQLISGRAALASLMNADPGSLQWPNEQYLLTDAEIANAEKQAPLHPARISADSQIEVQTASAKAAKAALWPSLSLQYRRQLEGTQFDPSNSGVILSVSFQTSNGVRGLLGYQAGKERVRAAEANAEAIASQIASTIKIDQAQLYANSIQLIVQQQAADAANTLVDGYLRQFDVGRRSWLDVLNIQREAHEYMLQSVALKRAYWYSNGKLALDAMYWKRLTQEPAAAAEAQPN